jgi:hypothetical protein
MSFKQKKEKLSNYHSFIFPCSKCACSEYTRKKKIALSQQKKALCLPSTLIQNKALHWSSRCHCDVAPVTWKLPPNFHTAVFNAKAPNSNNAHDKCGRYTMVRFKIAREIPREIPRGRRVFKGPYNKLLRLYLLQIVNSLFHLLRSAWDSLTS